MTTGGQWREIARLSELGEGIIYPRIVAGHELILVRKGSEILCFSDKCSHQPVRLSEFGEVLGNEILCQAHGARFDLCGGGKPLCFPGRDALESWPVRLEFDKVMILL